MRNKKYKATAVSYLNTKPFLYGIIKSGLDKEIDIQLNIPSVGAQQLQSGEVDFGLVPVAVVPEVPGAQLFSNYCIGTEGAVKTVCIYSQVPIEQLTHLYLDHHSKSSVALTKVLLKNYWRLSPQLLSAREGYISRIKRNVGGLVIGDRAIGLEKEFKYVYDLGEEWQRFTGLPFVFATWISTHTLPDDFIHRFDHALQRGLDAIPELLYLLPTPTADFSLEEYFNEYISYDFDAPKRKALELFLNYVEELDLVGV
ncbi:MAG: menaquinone biosynthesis protein [Bacteroidota bacterium]